MESPSATDRTACKLGVEKAVKLTRALIKIVGIMGDHQPSHKTKELLTYTGFLFKCFLSAHCANAASQLTLIDAKTAMQQQRSPATR